MTPRQALAQHLKRRPANQDVEALYPWLLERERLELLVALAQSPMEPPAYILQNRRGRKALTLPDGERLAQLVEQCERAAVRLSEAGDSHAWHKRLATLNSLRSRTRAFARMKGLEVPGLPGTPWSPWRAA